ncbi:hypothetical protein SH601_09150 [Gracilibacillus sp. S3-1-1]|uniref:Uncharacterized protein n=1 Tax=Gracilibacillus pellucidus TaxID=3095368 RepID=A0ACC6M5I9_9BACI|nr:hypothetical protein [Gracilibacillus sp. S3-1-1]MDX8046156.1 hypothetical protein [Gracilibacillus sp. S3-1-1]
MSANHVFFSKEVCEKKLSRLIDTMERVEHQLEVANTEEDPKLKHMYEREGA